MQLNAFFGLLMALTGAAEAAAVAAAPTGKYEGSKAVLGTTIDITVTLESSSLADVKIAGPLHADCDKEAYTYDGKSTMDLTNKDKAGDCVHDALAKAPGGGSLTSVTYDSTGNTITLTAKIAFLTVTLLLKHETDGGVVEVQQAGEDEHQGWFKEFVHTFGKSYSAAEHAMRFNVFKQNLGKIQAANSVAESLVQWPSQHSDLTSEEFGALQFKH